MDMITSIFMRREWQSHDKYLGLHDSAWADLQQLVAAGEIEDAEDDEVQDAKPRELPTSLSSYILREVDKQLQLLEDNDYNAEWSRIAVRGESWVYRSIQTLDAQDPGFQERTYQRQPECCGN
ncbi:hypothetical protein Hamer_G008572 [Homarus americanus]|uniref:Uncharacterized protein n=1 Tax=Homarus americanus TaxID=6706 RepID=A0A8J5N578_HOMAM|nr:hypothetical protein Hamer_G008572 [Homarus americanus]